MAGTNSIYGIVNSAYDAQNGFYADSGAGAVSKSLSVPYAASSAYAFYGLNKLVLTWERGRLSEDHAAFADVQSNWIDSLVITNGVGSGVVKFLFRLAGRASYPVELGPFVAAWADASSPLGDFTPQLFSVVPGSISKECYFTVPFVYGQPFRLRSGMEVWNFAESGLFDLEFKLACVLLPDGAAIGSVSSGDWLSGVTVIHPSFGISTSGSKAILHWFAIQEADLLPLTASDLFGLGDWRAAEGVAQKAGEYEFSLTLPMDRSWAFFRGLYNW